MSNVCAGIGRGQLEVLDERVAQRRANFFFYKEFFKDIEGVTFLEEVENSFSNFWLTTILVDEKLTGGITGETIRLALEKGNIEARPLWKPMHLQPIFETSPFYGDGTSEKLFGQGLCLPSGSNMTDDDRERISNTLKSIFKEN
jgi:dTDP-4-amino-4,6-dideoxygalactose transaminase